ncbi:MAG: ABC transporter ATP-binding protein [Thermoplasmataceae archaeon]
MDEVLTVDHVAMEYRYAKSSIKTIEDISFKVRKNEFVSIIGPSGCGKSTLIRMILGLTKPTSGRILYGDKEEMGSDFRVSVVFQNSALFPWLDVLDNVELALEPMIKDRSKRREIALNNIRLVGIDGFENAYPKELSGGMKQRVAIARALSTSPDVLLLDEPFSGLDVFSAQAMREELLDLWESPVDNPNTILMVTHNVDEAVQMSDSIVILSHRPSKVIQEMPVSLKRPRNTRSDEFYKTVDRVLTIMSE